MAHRTIDPASPPGEGSRLPPIRPSWIIAALGAVATLAVGWWLLRPAPPPVEATLPMAGGATSAPGPAGAGGPGPAAGPSPSNGDGAATSSTTAPVVAEVVVQAAGAVRKPGVYRLPADGRIDDLVRRAGGLRPDADRRRLNLAAPLVDGERVWIPAVGEEVPEVVTGAGGAGATGGTGTPAGGGSGAGPSGEGGTAGPVDLNTASEAELDELPGIGPATAAAILAHRETVGPFASVDDLLDVRGIGEAKLEQLRPLVTT